MRYLIGAVTAALLLTACATKPAQIELASCDTYAATLHELALLRAGHKLSDGQVKIVDEVRVKVNPVCDSTPPDLKASPLDTASDALVKELQAILTQAKGS